MKSAFQITGFEEYAEKLVRAGLKINQVSRDALDEASKIILAEMQSRVPVDTGNLLNHLTIKTPTREGDYNYREIGIIYDLAYTDKKTSIQARTVEFGSVHMAARPFIRPAIRAVRSEVVNLIKSRLAEAGMVDK
jgi:HK97 gp10 family phage protein